MTDSASNERVRAPRPTLSVKRIRPAYEQVAEQLMKLILERELAPGDRLPVEADIASAFGVSRGTVREALRVLVARNLVSALRGANGGNFVASRDPAALSASLEAGIGLLTGTEAITLDELLEARQLLEVPAARLAAERRTDAAIEDLRQAREEERFAGEGGVRFHQHRRFHTAVLAASGNRLLHLMTLPIFGVIRSRYVLRATETVLWRQIDHDHGDILHLVIAGDAAGAGQAMDEHLRRLNIAYRAIENQRV